MSVKLTILTDCGHETLEIDQSNDVLINLSIKDFTKLGGTSNNRAYYTQEIGIAWTLENCKKLGIPYNTNFPQGKDYRNKKKTALLESGVLSFRGDIVLNGFNKAGKVKTIQAQFRGLYADWITRLDCDLCDLRVSEYIHDRTTIEQIFLDDAIYDGTNPVYFGLIWNGLHDPFSFPANNIALNHVSITEIRPQIAAKAIIEAIEQKAGIPIKSKFFDSDYFRNKWYPFGRKEIAFEATNAVLNNGIPFTQAGSSQFNFELDDWVLNDLFGFVSPLGVNQYPFIAPDAELTLKMSIDVNIVSGSPYFFVTDSQNSYEGTSGVKLENGINEIEYTFPISKGQFLEFRIFGGEVDLLAGTSVSMCLLSERMTEGAKAWASSVLPCTSISDYLGGLADSYNLIYYYSEKDDCLIIEPKFKTTLPNGEVVPGFYSQFINENIKIEYSCENEETEFSLSTEYKNRLIQKFKDDSNDECVDEEDGLFASEQTLSDAFEVGETEIENRVFAPTKLGELPTPYAGDNPPTVPFMISYNPDDDEPNKSMRYAFEMRELTKVGSTAGDWFWYADGNELNVYPRLVQVSEEDGINAGYADVGGLIGLTNTFFAKDIELYQCSMLRNIEAHIEKCSLLCRDDLFRLMLWVDINCGSKGRHIVESIQYNLSRDAVSAIRCIPVDY